MKRFLMATALAVVLSGTALAGIIPTTDSPQPQPPPASNAVLAIVLTIISAVVR
jgi:hypothetical protein